MSRFQEHARFTGFQSFGQSAEAASSVRVEQIMVFLPHFPHSFGNLLVGISGTADFSRDGGMATSIKVEYTGKVARVAHIHRVGNGSDAGTRRINARLQVLEENVIAVVGSDKAFHGQSHTLPEESGSDVTEVTAGYTHDGIVSLAGTFQLSIGIKVIERLRQETRHVDGIGAGQLQVLVEFPVHKSGFNQSLAIVERTIDLNGRDILP